MIRNQDWEFVTIAREPVDTAVSLMKQYIKDRSGGSGAIEINKELILLVRDKSQLFRFLNYFTSIVKKKLEIVEQKFMIGKPEKFLMHIGSEFNVPCPDVPKTDLKNPNPGLRFLPMWKENFEKFLENYLKMKWKHTKSFLQNLKIKSMIKHIKISDKVISELREIVKTEIMKSCSAKILDLSNIHDVLEKIKSMS